MVYDVKCKHQLKLVPVLVVADCTHPEDGGNMFLQNAGTNTSANLPLWQKTSVAAGEPSAGHWCEGMAEEEEDVQIGDGTVWSETVTVQWWWYSVEWDCGGTVVTVQCGVRLWWYSGDGTVWSETVTVQWWWYSGEWDCDGTVVMVQCGVRLWRYSGDGTVWSGTVMVHWWWYSVEWDCDGWGTDMWWRISSERSVWVWAVLLLQYPYFNFVSVCHSFHLCYLIAAIH